jgi:hypothetical protein
MASRYWVGGSADWDGTAGSKWAATSGGAGIQAVPTESDDVFFDAASGAVTVTLAGTNDSRDRIFTGFTGTITGSGAQNIAGSLLLVAGMTYTPNGAVAFKGTSKTITSAGKTLSSSGTVEIETGSYSLVDALITAGDLKLTAGTFDANNQNVTAANFISNNSNVRTLTMGSGTFTLTGTGTVWDFGTVTNLTFNANTSTIKLTSNSASNKTFVGNGRTFNNYWNDTAGAGVVIITGSNTFNNFKVSAGRTQHFEAGTTTTFATLTDGGSIVINSSSAATHTLSCPSGTVAVTGATITYSIAGGGATFNATNSTNGGNNTGWNFLNSPPTVTTQAVTNITNSTATGNGNVTSAGDATVTERGIVWATSPLPTTSDNKSTSPGTVGAFSVPITGISIGITYYARAYAISSFGTSYGNEVSFSKPLWNSPNKSSTSWASPNKST